MKVKHKIPNSLTMLNLVLGVMSILLVVDNKGQDLTVFACLLILAAALTDRFDGKLARRFDVESNIGRELDSLSDLVSFGIAPVVLSWKTCFNNMGIWGYLIAIIFPLAGAYRLARFNVAQTPIIPKMDHGNVNGGLQNEEQTLTLAGETDETRPPAVLEIQSAETQDQTQIPNAGADMEPDDIFAGMNAYTGLPITIAGAFLILVNLFNCYILSGRIDIYNLPRANKVITSVFTLLLSYFMVSKVKIRKR